MIRWTVYTPMGDWRGIWATSADNAKRKVAHIIFFRVPLADMTAVRE